MNTSIVRCQQNIRKILKCCAHNLNSKRKFDTNSFTHHKELLVSPYSNIEINCPHAVKVQPLNPFNFPNQDKILVTVLNNGVPAKQPELQCFQKGDAIKVNCGMIEDQSHSYVCAVQAPIKANLDLVTESGHVEIGTFENDHLRVTSLSGNITIEPFCSNAMALTSIHGNITCKKVTQANSISLVSHSGVITTDRLQAQKLNLITDDGDISLESSYCTESEIRTRSGNLHLQNLHLKCKVHVGDKGNINLIRFDGELELVMTEGNAEITLSRITNDSVIVIEKTGNLTLKVADECNNHTAFRIASNDYFIDTKFSVENQKSEGLVLIKPKLETKNNVLIDCRNSKVKIETADFLDMFNLNK